MNSGLFKALSLLGLTWLSLMTKFIQTELHEKMSNPNPNQPIRDMNQGLWIKKRHSDPLCLCSNHSNQKKHIHTTAIITTTHSWCQRK